jgi:hypothetical protein
MPRVGPPLTALLLLATLPSGIPGQTADRAGTAGALAAGDSVRLEISGSRRLEGRLIFADPATLTLESLGGSVRVSLPDVERLWVRGRQTRKGAWIGAIAGGVSGIAAGLLISQVACEPVDGGDCTAAEVAAFTGLVGGAGGAALGAGIGFMIPAWHLRFP